MKIKIRLKDIDSFYFDFYREKLLAKYGNSIGYINDELRRLQDRKIK
jgi:hypothetical protein